MKQIPTTLVLAALFIICAAWPSVQQWSDTSLLHHYLVHVLYILSGSLIGLQTAQWINQPTTINQVDEAGVSS